MADWTNIFAIGECALTVHKNGSATAMTSEEMTADSVTLSADVAGLVSFSADPGLFVDATYEVRVSPAYDTGAASVRIVSMGSTGATINGVYPAWSPNPQTYSDIYPTGQSSETLGPDYAFTPDQAWTYVSATAQAGGA